MKHLIVALSLAALAACGDTTYNLTTNTNTNAGSGPGTPGASPSPPAGSCPGAALIASIRVNPFGYQCGSGQTPPNNNSGLLPLGCTAIVTATPKDASGRDVDAIAHGPDISWSIPIGSSIVEMTDWPGNTFNKNVRSLSPGEFQISATVCGKTGAWNGRVPVQ